MTYDSVIVGSHVITPRGMEEKNIVIDEGKIVSLTTDIPASDKKINCQGLKLINIQNMVISIRHSIISFSGWWFTLCHS